jgi:hypothetical protein
LALGGEIVWSGYEGEVWGDEYCGGRAIANGDGEFVSERESQVAGMSTVLVGELRLSISEDPDGQLFPATFPIKLFLSASNDMKIQYFLSKHTTVRSSLKKINPLT